MQLNDEQKIQEEQYNFPYHYLPSESGGQFGQHAYWSWGFRYLGGLRVARDLCFMENYGSLLDVGCGDGRFIADLYKDYPSIRLKGVDYSEKAVALAKAMNPGLDYAVADIFQDDLGGEKFDVVSLIEVIEHIPPKDLPDFIGCCLSFLKPGGRLVVTVPHKNKTVTDKHFQHFDSQMLRDLLNPQANIEEIKFFDVRNRLLQLWFRLLGGTGNRYLITWQPLLRSFYRFYLKNGLYTNKESYCGRIACMARGRSQVEYKDN